MKTSCSIVASIACSRANVIGWSQGRFEWGPRALGNRSIIADPRNPNMKDIVNTKIKFREPYRPFAPSVLAERSGEVLRTAECHGALSGALHAVRSSGEAAKHSGAAGDHARRWHRTIADGVQRRQSPRYYKLIERFGQATGVPVILNTSFNLKGEPIVNTPANAFSTFSADEMDKLVLGNFVVEKERLQQSKLLMQAEPVAAK